MSPEAAASITGESVTLFNMAHAESLGVRLWGIGSRSCNISIQEDEIMWISVLN